MTGQELIEFIQREKLEDFEIGAGITDDFYERISFESRKFNGKDNLRYYLYPDLKNAVVEFNNKKITLEAAAKKRTETE